MNYFINRIRYNLKVLLLKWHLKRGKLCSQTKPTNQLILVGIDDETSSLGINFRRFCEFFKHERIQYKSLTIKRYCILLKSIYGYFFSKYNYTETLICFFNSESVPCALLQHKLIGKRMILYLTEEIEFSDFDLQIARQFDEIWVPSQFVYEKMEKHFKKNLYIISPVPLSFVQNVNCIFDRSTKNIRLICAMEAQSSIRRKNVLLTVDFLIKVLGRYDNVEASYIIRNCSSEIISSIENKIVSAKNISSRLNVITSFVPESNWASFLKSHHICISLHRSEGFGLLIADALSIGLKVVATGYSGFEGFSKSVNFFSVDFTLETVPSTEKPGLKSSGSHTWACPDLAHAHEQFDRALSSCLNRETSPGYLPPQEADQAFFQTLSYKRSLDRIELIKENRVEIY